MDLDIRPIDPSHKKSGKPLPLTSWNQGDNPKIFDMLQFVEECYLALCLAKYPFPQVIQRYELLDRATQFGFETFPQTPRFTLDTLMAGSVSTSIPYLSNIS